MDFGTKKILITGANGWLGQNLLDALINGLIGCEDLKKPNHNLKIRCLLLRGEKLKFKNYKDFGIEISYGSIINKDDCYNFTEDYKGAILFHCAGIIHPKRIKDFYKINVDGAENLIYSAVKNKVKKVIVVSSNSPCGTNPNRDHLFDENSLYNPYLNYGISKMLMEKVVKKYNTKGDIESVIIRPPWFYGPHQPKRQNRFYNMIKNGSVPIVGDGQNKRSMACTLNICQALIKSAIIENSNGKIFWIADKKPYTFHEIISTIREVMVKEFKIKCIDDHIQLPSFISEIAYYFDKTIQWTGFYNQEIHVLSEMNKTIACSVIMAKKEINYNPNIDLYEGTVLSLKSQLGEFI